MILALVSDLFFDAKITATGKAVGVDVVAVRTTDAAAAKLADAVGLIVDLSLPIGDPIEFVRTVNAAHPSLRIVAFLPHVEADRRRLAKEAGAHEVLPRSKFAETLGEILCRLAKTSL